MTIPPFLLPGAKVAIISPAGHVQRELIERGAELLERQGFQVEIGRHAFDQSGVYSGSDTARAADMYAAGAR